MTKSKKELDFLNDSEWVGVKLYKDTEGSPVSKLSKKCWRVDLDALRQIQMKAGFTEAEIAFGRFSNKTLGLQHVLTANIQAIPYQSQKFGTPMSTKLKDASN